LDDIKIHTASSLLHLRSTHNSSQNRINQITELFISAHSCISYYMRIFCPQTVRLCKDPYHICGPLLLI